MEFIFTTIEAVQISTCFAVLALLLSLVAFSHYIRDTLTLQTQPQRASWLIWSTLSLIAFYTQITEGATTSLWFIGAQFACTFSIFMLSIWYGSGSYLSRRNITIFAAASFGLLLWYASDDASYALIMTITISAIGGYATITKAYRAPESETFSTWVLLAAASICGIASVGALDWVYLAYPVYLFGLYGSIVIAVVLGRSRNEPTHVGEDRHITTVGATESASSNPLGGQQVTKPQTAA